MSGRAIEAAKQFTKTGQASRISARGEILKGLTVGFSAAIVFKVGVAARPMHAQQDSTRASWQLRD